MNLLSSFVIAFSLAVAPVAADIAAENEPFALARIYSEKLAKGAEVFNGADGLAIYELVPLSAEQGWTLALADFPISMPAHYHEIQTTVLIVLEGKLKQTIEGRETVYSAGQHVVVPKGVVHSSEPVGDLCRIMEVVLEAKAFPEDIYWVAPTAATASDVKADAQGDVIVDGTVSEMIEPLRTIPNFDLAYAANTRTGEKYTLYDLAPAGTVEGNPWSATLLEIYETPMHHHLIGKEIFVVVNGEAEVTDEDEIYHLLPGQVIHIPPMKKHKVKSATEEPVRILFVNFPAYDRKDTQIDG